jgi:hypothetical protein
MDHLLNAIQPFYEVEADMFLSEWKSGVYRKYSDCPSYESLKTIIKSANIILDYLGWERLTIKKLVLNGI